MCLSCKQSAYDIQLLMEDLWFVLNVSPPNLLFTYWKFIQTFLFVPALYWLLRKEWFSEQYSQNGCRLFNSSTFDYTVDYINNSVESDKTLRGIYLILIPFYKKSILFIKYMVWESQFYSVKIMKIALFVDLSLNGSTIIYLYINTVCDNWYSIPQVPQNIHKNFFFFTLYNFTLV